MVSNCAQCLINLPYTPYNYSLTNPGYAWTANDQCQMIYGNDATFCTVKKGVFIYTFCFSFYL